MRKKLGAVLVGAAALSLTLTACGGGGGESESGGGGGGEVIDTSTASGDVNYWLWDNAQLPAYQACADAFKTANPNVNVKISQFAWDDYWAKLTNGFIAGDAPDVFTDHLSKYPEFVSQQQLLALDETLTKDGFNVDQYQPGLADLWKGQTASATACPRISTPLRSSTTRSWSQTRESRKPISRISPGTPPTAERMRRPSRT
jgi:multiple sugar transport system substrate-binding protein